MPILWLSSSRARAPTHPNVCREHTGWLGGSGTLGAGELTQCRCPRLTAGWGGDGEPPGPGSKAPRQAQGSRLGVGRTGQPEVGGARGSWGRPWRGSQVSRPVRGARGPEPWFKFISSFLDSGPLSALPGVAFAVELAGAVGNSDVRPLLSARSGSGGPDASRELGAPPAGSQVRARTRSRPARGLSTTRICTRTHWHPWRLGGDRSCGQGPEHRVTPAGRPGAPEPPPGAPALTLAGSFPPVTSPSRLHCFASHGSILENSNSFHPFPHFSINFSWDLKYGKT